MIESMDDAVGTLLDTLDRLDLTERTIVVFFSDNGGNMYDEVDGTTPTSNRPLRGGKATMFEGGVRVPCIVIWPGVVDGASTSDAMVESSDFYPTILEMLAIAPRANQRFDGISIVPALKDQPLARDAIFTYFPHNPRVPDWLPPAVAVHQDDWKLIRIFFGGEKNEHRWKLFHLREDLSEKRDLAASQPKRVQQLDALIDQFLADTNAVLPIPNPAFDPAQYRPENEGVPAPRRKPAAKKTAGRKRPPAKPVAGWKPSADCALTVAPASPGGESSLLITSSGGDPYLSYDLPQPLPAGRMVVQLTMASTGGGSGQFFWQEQGVRPPFFRDRSVVFAMTHDDQPCEYRVSFTAAHPITAVRIDPGQAPGKIRVQSMRLLNSEEETLFDWKFALPDTSGDSS
jgi:hypothetical protein